MNCLNCNNTITSKHATKFCSRTCAAKYNNVFYPKRKKLKATGNCRQCAKEISAKLVYCKDCTISAQAKQYTIADIKALYAQKTSMAIAAKIRGYGRVIYDKSTKPKLCINCGYNKHYEVCHIVAIKDFPDAATMSEVHALDNLIALCPNCHWEFDHGMLTLPF